MVGLHIDSPCFGALDFRTVEPALRYSPILTDYVFGGGLAMDFTRVFFGLSFPAKPSNKNPI